MLQKIRKTFWKAFIFFSELCCRTIGKPCSLTGGWVLWIMWVFHTDPWDPILGLSYPPPHPHSLPVFLLRGPIGCWGLLCPPSKRMTSQGVDLLPGTSLNQWLMAAEAWTFLSYTRMMLRHDWASRTPRNDLNQVFSCGLFNWDHTFPNLFPHFLTGGLGAFP